MRLIPVLLVAAGMFVGCSTTEDLGTHPDAGSGDGGGNTDAGADGNADAGDDGGSSGDAPSEADVDSGPWSPRQLTGLQLWLDGSVGIVADPAHAGQVKRWLDQSGNGHDATGIDGGNGEPLIDPAAVGGKTSVLCQSQASMTIDDSPGLQFGTGDWAIIMVAKIGISVGVAGPVLYQKVTPSGIQLDVTGSADFQVQAAGVGGGIAAVANTPVGSFQIMSGRGTKLEARVGTNVATGPTTTADISAVGPVVTICASSNGTSVDLAEMLAVKGTVSDADLDKTVTYLKAKYGL